MTTPNKIPNSCDESVASCAPPPDSSYFEPVSSENRCSSSETVVAVEGGREYVQDDHLQVSYSRPVDPVFRSSRVLTSVPAENLTERRAALVLGQALARAIGASERRGEPIPEQAYELLRILNRGELPSREEVNEHPFFNQSLIDTRLDAVIHAVAVKASGENQLHQTALALSLQYYFSQNPTDAADLEIRQGLITALSSDAQGRQILAQAGQSAPPPVRAQITQAMMQGAVETSGGALARGAAAQGAAAGGASASSSAAHTPSNLQTALAVGTRTLAATNPSANALLTGASLVLGAMGFGQGPFPAHQESLLWPYPIVGYGPSGASVPTVLRDIPFLREIFHSSQNEGPSSEAHNAPEAPRAHGGPEAAPPASRSHGPIPEAPAPSRSAPPSAVEPAGVRGILPHAFQSIGANPYATQAIFSVLPSPFTLAAVALQGGYAAAFLSQASVQNPHASVYSYAPHAIAAVSSAAETHADSDANHSDSGQGRQGGQGQGQDEQPHDERQPEQDTYLA